MINLNLNLLTSVLHPFKILKNILVNIECSCRPYLLWSRVVPAHTRSAHLLPGSTTGTGPNRIEYIKVMGILVHYTFVVGEVF